MNQEALDAMQKKVDNLTQENKALKEKENFIATIRKLAAANSEIIERLKQRKGKLIVGYNYQRAWTEADKLTVTEVPISVDIQPHLRIFQVTVQLHSIEDFFNDKLDYTCKNFADLERLNKDMLTVALKCALFEENAKSVLYFRQFVENFRRVSVGLEQLVRASVDVKSQRDQLQQKVNQINLILSTLPKTPQPADVSVAGTSDFPCNR
jgi:hypothetical protein